MMPTPLIILTSNAGFKIYNSNNLSFNSLDPLDTHSVDFEWYMEKCGLTGTYIHYLLCAKFFTCILFPEVNTA